MRGGGGGNGRRQGWSGVERGVVVGVQKQELGGELEQGWQTKGRGATGRREERKKAGGGAISTKVGVAVGAPARGGLGPPGGQGAAQGEGVKQEAPPPGGEGAQQGAGSPQGPATLPSPQSNCPPLAVRLSQRALSAGMAMAAASWG